MSAARRLHNNGEPEPIGYDTIEEAIAAAMAELEPGGIVVIHHEDCEQDDEDDEACTCEPLELAQA